MFEQFSRGYYLGRLYVQPREGEGAVMSATQHERVNEQLYSDSDGVQRLDRPLVMKLGTSHFTVCGDEAVPADTLALPREMLEAGGVDNPPTLSEVLLAKADRAAQLLKLTGTTQPFCATGDGGPAGI